LQIPVYTWNSLPEERGASYPCDRYLGASDVVAFRAVDIDAPANVAFRWLCQLRVAPYSYDWIDNFGRRSPRVLTAGLERLHVGQPVMTIFRLAEFEPDRSLTICHTGRVFGRVAVTYQINSTGAQGCRLVVKLLVSLPRSPLRRLLGPVLAAGDLIMMRRQLLNLKALSEASRDESWAPG
jgi:hypothetical protein